MQSTFAILGVSLAIGLLIGTERGWQHRDAEAGERIAGVRTFGLLGLLGGGSGLLVDRIGALPIGMFFIAMAGLMVTVYAVNLKRREDSGITSMIAALLTFVLGALAGVGLAMEAAAAAVVVTLLLSHKSLLHGWLEELSWQELTAGLKLLLISVVLLPLLPDRGFGPWQALNPYEIWWMVVLIAALSFVGYFAMRIGGARRGALFTGLAGGLASSTALTLHFSRLAREHPESTGALANGILLGSGTMFPRLLLVAGVINRDLITVMLVPALGMAAVIFGIALLSIRTLPAADGMALHERIRNPLELRIALGFGLLLAVVMLLGKALTAWFGDAGVWSLAAASGVADVDAINLSLARMSTEDLPLALAAGGALLAAAVNTIVKAGMVHVLGGRGLFVRAGLPLLGAAATGLLLLVILII